MVVGNDVWVQSMEFRGYLKNHTDVGLMLGTIYYQVFHRIEEVRYSDRYGVEGLEADLTWSNHTTPFIAYRRGFQLTAWGSLDRNRILDLIEMERHLR
jgi:hypothetical protein